jgi:hypothetical protein
MDITDYCELCDEPLDWDEYPSPVKSSPGENYHSDCFTSKLEHAATFMGGGDEE